MWHAAPVDMRAHSCQAAPLWGLGQLPAAPQDQHLPPPCATPPLPLPLQADRPESVQDFAFASAPTGSTSVSPLFARAQRLADKRRLVSEWLGAVTGAAVPADSDEAFRAALKDGVTLCRLLNTLQPGTIPRVSVKPA